MSKLYFLTLFLIYSYSLFGQESFILSGYITDVETNEKLIGFGMGGCHPCHPFQNR